MLKGRIGIVVMELNGRRLTKKTMMAPNLHVSCFPRIKWTDGPTNHTFTFGTGASIGGGAHECEKEKRLTVARST